MHALADHGLWDKSATKMAAKWRKILSMYTISSPEFSDEEGSMLRHSTLSIDFESKEEDSKQGISKLRVTLKWESNLEDSKARKKKI